MSLCGFSPKAIAITAGILTLLQGLIWSIIGTLSILVYSCSIQATEDSTTSQSYRLYLVYLYSGKCGSVDIEAETDNGTVLLNWPEIGVRASGRTYSFVIIYLILSVVWVITALLLIIATVSDITRVKGVVLRLPWLFLTSLFVILDLITSVYYSIDISYTSSLEELLEFVGLVVEPDLITPSSTSPTFSGYRTMEPSILAVIIFSRVIIGWILNLLFLVHVAQDLKNGESPEVGGPPEPRRPYQEYLQKLSTIGPVPDVKWDPYQRKRSDLPVLKPLEKPSPPNERKRKQSDYQQYLFYAKKSSQLNYLDDIKSEPPTPAPGSGPPGQPQLQPSTTGVWPVSTPSAEVMDDSNRSANENENFPGYVPVPEPDYDFESLPNNSYQNSGFADSRGILPDENSNEKINEQERRY